MYVVAKMINGFSSIRYTLFRRQEDQTLLDFVVSYQATINLDTNNFEEDDNSSDEDYDSDAASRDAEENAADDDEAAQESSDASEDIESPKSPQHSRHPSHNPMEDDV